MYVGLLLTALHDLTRDLRHVHQQDQAEKHNGHTQDHDQRGGTDGNVDHRLIHQKHLICLLPVLPFRTTIREYLSK